MTPKSLAYAPQDVFQQIQRYAVIPTFDLIVWIEEKGVVLVKRKIAPYKATWALPGLRMMKPEGIEDTLARIAEKEIGVAIDPAKHIFIDQYVGKFKTESNRQDLSTCYAFFVDPVEVVLNSEHFSSVRFIRNLEQAPVRTGV